MYVCFIGRTHIVRVCVLASSSSGNATFLQAGRTRILVDAGLSRREISHRLASIGEDVRDLDAILVTHEHSDHVSGLVAMAKADRERRSSIPIYMTHLTAPAICWHDYTPALECFQAGSTFSIGDIEVRSFTIPHDAVDPVGFCFRSEGIRVGLATDLGYLPDSIRVHLRGVDILILESNHDVEMLKVGPYPWPVKQRVLGRNGHLSNDVTCGFIRDELDTNTSTLILGHLSEQNNHPEIVRLSASQALEGRSLFTRLVVAEPGRQTEVFTY
ncbi:MAG TPA: MBL fold metallo-hydrolase [Bryobacteraceae bacterium]|nr:MBL fold metallo-hydrolase [Bryobacteraceae bacterium]